ncbi:hypothetical protein BCR33DRAFT_712077 [Rhizoclosmatium globosum]|uniref:Uncharacterized protein n=1 Tax=Rhizoclosmatium globosum TaxID=329046 RepID=A0A1Y2C0B1_9FUNG|nr:hypothetical protein BCR33DRAFT_719450 [Rhizoclosmatium globosum]ORY51878.1 hypothetical protein BCR33DRAFT_712077 [Rhizoclosmatium globosum]|eukprot:ORY40472.1 hypothetical protein BCR33DRAFT_719450 [Rhizoclosmatium globosum]
MNVNLFPIIVHGSDSETDSGESTSTDVNIQELTADAFLIPSLSSPHIVDSNQRIVPPQVTRYLLGHQMRDSLMKKTLHGPDGLVVIAKSLGVQTSISKDEMVQSICDIMDSYNDVFEAAGPHLFFGFDSGWTNASCVVSVLHRAHLMVISVFEKDLSAVSRRLHARNVNDWVDEIFASIPVQYAFSKRVVFVESQSFRANRKLAKGLVGTNLTEMALLTRLELNHKDAVFSTSASIVSKHFKLSAASKTPRNPNEKAHAYEDRLRRIKKKNAKKAVYRLWREKRFSYKAKGAVSSLSHDVCDSILIVLSGVEHYTAAKALAVVESDDA